MTTKPTLKLAAALLLLTTLNSQLSTWAQGTAFTYQGRLNDGVNPANGKYDFQFQVFDQPGVGTGTSYGSPNPNQTNGVAVSNGLFTVVLDFGTGVFTGPDRWLEIKARTNGALSFGTLSPRQKLTPTPYAIYAGNAAQVGGQGATAFVAKAGDTMTGTLNLPANGLNVGSGQLVASGGNVGIGTASPGSKLHVRPGPDQNLHVYSAGALGDGVTLWSRGDSAAARGLELFASAIQLTTFGANPIIFAPNAVEKMRIDATGNVGIGTASPQALLNVNGTVRIDAASLPPYGEGLVLNSPTDLGYGGIHFHNAARGGALGTGTIRWSMFYNSTPDGGAYGQGFAFIQNNANTRLYLGTNGNVGIGTTSPQAKLEIQAGADTYGGNDPHALAFAYRFGGYRHWISSRHDGGGNADGNAIDFYLNNTNTVGGSSAPGIGNVKVMTLDAANGVKAVGGLVIETRTSDPSSPAPGQIWLRTDL